MTKTKASACSKSPAKGAKKKMVVPKNFQGYSLKRCVFRKVVGQRCYKPSGYANGHPKGSLDGSRFCKHCLLEPCFLIEKLDECNSVKGDVYLHHLWNTEGFSDMEKKQKNALVNPDWKVAICDKVFASVFSKKYAKKAGLPQCVHDYVDSTFPVTQEEQERLKEEQSEEEGQRHEQGLAKWKEVLGANASSSKEIAKSSARPKKRRQSVAEFIASYLAGEDTDSEEEEEFEWRSQKKGPPIDCDASSTECSSDQSKEDFMNQHQSWLADHSL